MEMGIPRDPYYALIEPFPPYRCRIADGRRIEDGKSTTVWIRPTRARGEQSRPKSLHLSVMQCIPGGAFEEADAMKNHIFPRFAFSCARFLIFVLIIGSAHEAFAEIWDRATVVTINGREYSEVVVQCEPSQDYLTMIDGSGSRQQLKYSMVRVVFDQAGLDITRCL